MHDVQFDQSYLFEEARLVYENDAEQQQQSCPEDQHCEPLEHLFELLQKGTLLNSHEELENCEQKSQYQFSYLFLYKYKIIMNQLKLILFNYI